MVEKVRQKVRHDATRVVMELLPPPADIGLPPKFTTWRPKQAEAIVAAAESDKRFVVLCMPTGSGKSLTYMALAKLTGYRTLILTSTKGLQNQLIEDFASCGAVDVRGMANYPCEYLIQEERVGHRSFVPGQKKDDIPTCDIGPCSGGMKCDAKESGGCHYYNAVDEAAHAQIVISNYAYWFNSNQREDDRGIGKFDMIVLDEAHNAPEELGSFLGVEVTMNQIEGLLGRDWPREHDNLEEWKIWARDMAKTAKTIAVSLENTIRSGLGKRKDLRTYKEVRRMTQNLSRVASSKGSWATHMARVGRNKYLTLHFDPVWPGEYAEKHLFCGIPHVILTSATIRPKTLQLLAVSDSTDVQFTEYPSTFPLERRPVIWVPTIRVDKRTTGDEMRIWVAKIDQIIGGRLDRKGVIHTVSYARVDLIRQWSKYAHLMFTHETATTRDVVADFKRADAPAVLVSPSMGTGYDFPYDECRYQIMGKVPFPDSRDKIIQARTQIDPEYAYYLTMQSLVQASGRGMRSEDDVCETFVIDDHISWFIGKWGSKLAPAWFRQSYRVSRGVPEAIQL